MSTIIGTLFPSRTPRARQGNDAASGRVEKAGRVETPDALDLALEKSQEVKTKLESCADDLHEVTETLARGIDDLARTESALAESREVLAETQAALEISQQGERDARRRALHDSMTGLPNRELFDDRLSHAISLARRHDWTLAVMFLDLDEFKKINDTQGHAAGDSVLKEVARRLSLHSRDEDTVCRNGGDEFLYLLVNPQGTENIERIARLVSANIAKPIAVGRRRFVVNASMGVAVYPVDGATGDELIRSADTAMYRAKKHASSCELFGRIERKSASA